MIVHNISMLPIKLVFLLLHSFHIVIVKYLVPFFHSYPASIKTSEDWCCWMQQEQNHQIELLILKASQGIICYLYVQSSTSWWDWFIYGDKKMAIVSRLVEFIFPFTWRISRNGQWMSVLLFIGSWIFMRNSIGYLSHYPKKLQLLLCACYKKTCLILLNANCQ